MKTTREIKYGDSSYALRFEMPETWDHANLSGVKVRLDGEGGTDLLTSTSATVPTFSNLSAAVLQGTNYLPFATAQTLSEGDRLLIGASADGPSEIVEVDYWDSVNKYAYLKADLRSDHASASTVKALWATYDADFSGSDFVKGFQFVITWEPQGTDDNAVKEMATISGASFHDVAFWRDIERRYPTVSTVVEETRRDGLAELLKDDYRVELESFGFDVDRDVDSPLFQTGLHLFAHYKILTGVGDEWEYEYGVAKEEWLAFIDRIKALEIWIDKDQDESLDDGETKAGSLFFEVEDF